jgi:thioredoxin reductase (NADPH)
MMVEEINSGSKENPYDLIIIGLGPAGLTAAIYAGRYNMKTLLVGSSYGGMIAQAHKVCNYPGFTEITGANLTKEMVNHVNNIGVPIKLDTITSVSKNGNLFVLTGHEGIFYSKTVIMATGSEKKRLEIVGEKEYLGKGVSYCATCDAAFFQDKDVCVVGGGDSALTSALVLSEFAKTVYIIYRKPEFMRAEPAWVEKVESNSKIKTIFNAELNEIKGEQFVSSVILKDNSEISLQGVFIEVGSEPNTSLLKDLNVEFDGNFIKVDRNQETSENGLYAAGDITNNVLKQVITACSEGAVAAFSAYKKSKSN